MFRDFRQLMLVGLITVCAAEYDPGAHNSIPISGACMNEMKTYLVDNRQQPWSFSVDDADGLKATYSVQRDSTVDSKTSR